MDKLKCRKDGECNSPKIVAIICIEFGYTKHIQFELYSRHCATTGTTCLNAPDGPVTRTIEHWRTQRLPMAADTAAGRFRDLWPP